jgi:protein-L-isoaspartate O-methyltransferase
VSTDLRALAERGNGADRAFVDANLRMAFARAADDEARKALGELHVVVREAARRAHSAMRAEIASGALRGAALRRVFDAQPTLERDHFAEEVLDVAYPPLAVEESVLDRELVTYTPSGYDEIVHALDVTKLTERDRFADIGAGTGKVVLLATLLTGASCVGIECEASLVARARAAAAEVGASRARFEHGDARTSDLEPADVVFMYVPFTGDTFAAFMARVAAMKPRVIACAPLDLERHPGFVPTGAPCSWLQVYARA